MALKATTRLRASDAQKEQFARVMLRRLAELGMNQSELARRMGVTRDAVSTYARHRSLPAPAQLKKMASILGIPADELLPSRYEYEDEAPLSIELRHGGIVRLKVDLDVPMELGVKIMNELQPHARAASKGHR